MQRKLLLVLGACALATPAAAQIITTSIPTAAKGAAAEKKAAFHLMAGYARWDYATLNAVEKEVPEVDIGKPQGFILAGDLTYNLNDSWSIGGGAWYNTANFTADTVILGENVELLSGDGNLFSAYGNFFWKYVGFQVGVVHNSQKTKWNPDTGFGTDEVSTTDWNAFVVGRYGGDRASVSGGLGFYSYGAFTVLGFTAEGSTVASGFVNGSVRIVKGLSVDAGIWYLGESEAKGDDATRLTIGLGYTF